MAREMSVQDLRQPHLNQLSQEPSHIVNPLRDNYPVALPEDLLGLLRQVHSHDTLLSQAGVAGQRAEQLNVLGLKYSRLKAQAPLEIQLLDFLYGEWEDIVIGFCVHRSEFALPVCTMNAISPT
jgi:hypothetical protein